jgi:ArsR family metal-binding transcriptional regulator
LKISRHLKDELAQMERQMQQHVSNVLPMNTTDDNEFTRHKHEQIHQTIDELIEKAAMKTRDAVRIDMVVAHEHLTRGYVSSRLTKFDSNTMTI